MVPDRSSQNCVPISIFQFGGDVPLALGLVSGATVFHRKMVFLRRLTVFRGGVPLAGVFLLAGTRRSAVVLLSILAVCVLPAGVTGFGTGRSVRQQVPSFPEASQSESAPESPGSASETRQVAPSTPGDARSVSAFQRLLCGVAAGACAKTVIAPVSRLEILFQTNPKERFALRSGLERGARIVREEGFLGLWKGHATTLVRVCPQAGLIFTTKPMYKERVAQFVAAPVYQEFLSGTFLSTFLDRSGLEQWRDARF